MKAVLKKLENQGLNMKKLWRNIKKLIIKTLLVG